MAIMHAFSPSAEQDKCAICSRAQISHGKDANCESCANIGPCNLIDDILMCATCEARDTEIKRELGEVLGDDEKANRAVALKNQFHRELAARIDMRETFVKEVTSIVDIEARFNDIGLTDINSHGFVTQVVSDLLDEWRALRSKTYNALRQIETRIVVDQLYLNHIVPKLREQEREKFKAFDITYKPTAVSAVVKPSKPRMSASEKSLQSMADRFKISIEQARVLLNQATKEVTQEVCTCAETPGICKLHPKGGSL